MTLIQKRSLKDAPIYIKRGGRRKNQQQQQVLQNQTSVSNAPFFASTGAQYAATSGDAMITHLQNSEAPYGPTAYLPPPYYSPPLWLSAAPTAITPQPWSMLTEATGMVQVPSLPPYSHMIGGELHCPSMNTKPRTHAIPIINPETMQQVKIFETVQTRACTLTNADAQYASATSSRSPTEYVLPPYYHSPLWSEAAPTVVTPPQLEPILTAANGLVQMSSLSPYVQMSGGLQCPSMNTKHGTPTPFINPRTMQQVIFETVQTRACILSHADACPPNGPTEYVSPSYYNPSLWSGGAATVLTPPQLEPILTAATGLEQMSSLPAYAHMSGGLHWTNINSKQTTHTIPIVNPDTMQEVILETLVDGRDAKRNVPNSEIPTTQVS